MPMIDLPALKRAVSLGRVLGLLDYLAVSRTKTRFRGYCPLRCGANSRCCNFDLARSLWHCFSCNKGGNQLDLYALARRMQVYPAALELCHRAGVELPLLDTAPPLCLHEPKSSEDQS